VVLSNQMRAVDWLARGAEYRGSAPAEVVQETLARIAAILRVSFEA
jgi:hypothetical protein